ncbi:Lys48-specific deubiquitinase Mindy family, Miy1 [Schizosaccharomyces osmophilus]|uniref:Lys48-specific deubiquitinase Mindy family, Miy1 n=1 Tax=Schizosaccharomyces osmophilus TaxID=2545709 RepID=A0AAF0AW49_9SCHI|nr:Lys48-specific deubiquitinase Mindy family, Miy1 [Schizosaccharomyces osmophilus]WBW73172.1 Lys48-specific deubiquitinase Mindy family, Miy1 [Schizosaccharomyces osmophilus]
MQENSHNSYRTRTISYLEPTSNRYSKRLVLCQTDNGPCPIIAIVNSLVLKSNDERSFSLPNKRHIPAEEVTDCLIQFAKRYALCEDFEDLHGQLSIVHFGQQLNPSILDIQKFEYGDEMFKLFGIPLVHGWLFSSEIMQDDQSSLKCLQELEYYEKIADTFAERRSLLEMLDNLTAEQTSFLEKTTFVDAIMEDRFTMQFLTSSGLQKILELIHPGEIVVLFRSCHFSTLYSNPESLSLFTLVTDSGYARTGEDVVWETFDDQVVETGTGELCSANFIPAVLVINQRKEEHERRVKEDERYAKGLARGQQQQSRNGQNRGYPQTAHRSRNKTPKKKHDEQQLKSCTIS